MDTKIFIMNENEINSNQIEEAASAIRQGKLVIFPTETVYGLGANALDSDSVKKIFVAKGRPADNPLIVHIKDKDDLKILTAEIPEKVNKLMERFWPGPLTLILNKSSLVPGAATGNLNTVAIRFPSNKIAISLIERAGVPIAAPSANSSGRVSGTTLKMCIEDLYGKVDYIIGGEDSEAGLESTVLDCTVEPYCVLRPGVITLEELNNIDESIYLDKSILCNCEFEKPKSPGMKYKHYAPKAEIKIIKGDKSKIAEYINNIYKDLLLKNKKVGIMCTDETFHLYEKFENVISMGKTSDEKQIASNLFKTLSYFDTINVEVILSEAIEESNIGLAIMNRLIKACSYNLINLG